MPRLNKASFKEKQFARKYIEQNGNGTAAALEAYNANRDSAEVIASRNMQKPRVLEEIDKILKKKGLNSDSYLADKIHESLEASIGVKATNKDAVSIINMLLKVSNSYPASKHVSLSYSKKEYSLTKPYSEVQQDLEQTTLASTTLIKDLE
jgi:hypothetical protein